MHHNDTTIFHYVLCAPLNIYLQRSDTAILRVVSDILASHKNEKMTDILQTDKVVVLIFSTLVTGAISKDRLKRK